MQVSHSQKKNYRTGPSVASVPNRRVYSHMSNATQLPPLDEKTLVFVELDFLDFADSKSGGLCGPM